MRKTIIHFLIVMLLVLIDYKNILGKTEKNELLKIGKIINLTPLEKFDGQFFNPNWSPDSTKIVYDDCCNIWIINSDGSNKKQLTTDGGRYPIWSPKGNKIAYLLENNIRVMNKDGSNKISVFTVTKKKNERNWINILSWTPVGNKIIFANNEEIWSVTMHGLSKKLSTIKNPNSSRKLSWGQVSMSWISPDCKKVAFILGNTRDTGAVSFDNNIWIMDITGKSKRVLDKHLKIYDGPPALEWSPDSSKIAYVSFEKYYWKGKCYIWIINADGTNKKLLVECDAFSTGSEFAFVPSISWSPSQSYLCVYLYKDKNKNGEWDLNIDNCGLWIIDIKTKERTNLFKNVFLSDHEYAYCLPCRWSPNEKKILFYINDNGRDDVWVATLEYPHQH